MARHSILTSLTFLALIPYLYASEGVTDVNIFEKVSQGGILDEAERTRAQEILEAWQLSENRPSPEEDPRLGAVLEEMARTGRLDGYANRRVAADVAAMARVRRDQMNQTAHGSQAEDRHTPGAWWAGPWARDFGVILVLAAGIVIGGILIAHMQRRSRPSPHG